jgi:16S rRNA (uracil1498-N3)-methyltransferase
MAGTGRDATAASGHAAMARPGQGATAVPARDARPPVFVTSPDALAGDVIVLSGPEGRHAATVRRITVGERVDVIDGTGGIAECVVSRARPGMLELAVRARRAEPPPDPVIVVVQALPKGDRGLLAVELMTEAGVDVVVPWAAQRCVTQWQGERGKRALERWRMTAIQAAKQARRARFPDVTGLAAIGDVVTMVKSASLAVLLDPGGPGALGAVPLPPGGDLLVIVGPEGGVSPAEMAVLTGAGALAAHLGPTVLRASTAGVVAASVLLSRSSRWR